MWCSKKQEMLASGAKAPDVQLKTLEGKSWQLYEALREAPVLLVFFKISCPTCQFTLPFLDRLSGSSSARIVTVSQDDARGTKEFQDRFGVHLPVVLDEGRAYAASNAFQISHVPSLFMVEQDGTISSSVSGFSKEVLTRIAERLQMPLFHAGEKVPQLRPG